MSKKREKLHECCHQGAVESASPSSTARRPETATHATVRRCYATYWPLILSLDSMLDARSCSGTAHRCHACHQGGHFSSCAAEHKWCVANHGLAEIIKVVLPSRTKVSIYSARSCVSSKSWLPNANKSLSRCPRRRRKLSTQRWHNK